MAGAMRDEFEHSKELFELRRKDDIISVIKEEIRPLFREIRTHSSSSNASCVEVYDEYAVDENTTLQRLPELETQFESPCHAAVLSKEVDVDAGDVYRYFYNVDQYIQKHEDAVADLSMVIVENSDDLGINADYAESYAKSALAIEPIGEISRSVEGF